VAYPPPAPPDPAPYRALSITPARDAIIVVDQRRLPHELRLARLGDCAAVAAAIADMQVRGAPLIGATAACGYALGLRERADDLALEHWHGLLASTRPTAVNLRWALDRVRGAVLALEPGQRAARAWEEAEAIVAEDSAINHAIGRHGLALLRAIAGRRGGEPVRILTHCNAGALATCGWGTATAPIFLARAEGLRMQVWVSETRPRLQGAALTAWELRERGVDHVLIADDAGAFLMQRGEVDVVLVGADRVTAAGDVCNKIGTYAKAAAAGDCGVPFYAAVPSPTIDFALADARAIPIESRAQREVLEVPGRTSEGAEACARIAPPGTRALNLAFDITPARLVSGLLTERGLVAARRDALAAAVPERVAGGRARPRLAPRWSRLPAASRRWGSDTGAPATSALG
jgi:methylthioribose-1-phosphate isomerase